MRIRSCIIKKEAANTVEARAALDALKSDGVVWVGVENALVERSLLDRIRGKPKWQTKLIFHYTEAAG